jgi:hypothetical protein
MGFLKKKKKLNSSIFKKDGGDCKPKKNTLNGVFTFRI